MALTACESRGVHSDWSEGAHFSPYTQAEFNARAARGEPGVFPAPTGYSIYASKKVNNQAGPRVVQQGTASSRTGEFAGPGVALGGTLVSASSANSSAHRANALVAAKEARSGGTPVNLDGKSLKVWQIDVGTTSYAVFRKGGGILGGSGGLDSAQGPAMAAALPSLTGCSAVAGPYQIGPGGRSNTHMVYALNCG